MCPHKKTNKTTVWFLFVVKIDLWRNDITSSRLITFITRDKPNSINILCCFHNIENRYGNTHSYSQGQIYYCERKLYLFKNIPGRILISCTTSSFGNISGRTTECSSENVPNGKSPSQLKSSIVVTSLFLVGKMITCVDV